MSTYRLHGFCQSGNAYKVALYLNCAGIPWEPVEIDFFGGQTRKADWREAVNSMGEAPVLEADGKRLTQSGAILTWLAERHGNFAPANPDERYEALRWILFDNHKFTANFATRRFLTCFAPHAPDPAVLAFLQPRIDGAFQIVEKHLAGQPYLVGKRPTIADFSLAGYIYYPVEETGIDLARQYPAIHAWAERLKSLPGWKGPYELLPGKRVAPLAR
jgi:glutathione S-transferase